MPVVINVNGRALLKGEGLCPHLKFEGSVASCAVHDEPWFKKSPCYAYGNADIDYDFLAKKGLPCAVGVLIQAKGGLKVMRPDMRQLTAEELEDAGPWPT
jgi:hypothetical protein